MCEHSSILMFAALALTNATSLGTDGDRTYICRTCGTCCRLSLTCPNDTPAITIEDVSCPGHAVCYGVINGTFIRHQVSVPC